MEKMYRVLLANGSSEFCEKLAATLKQTDRYVVVGTATDGVRQSACCGKRTLNFSW